jgi:hypothetical protein
MKLLHRHFKFAEVRLKRAKKAQKCPTIQKSILAEAHPSQGLIPS